jgi:hypothetical protein
MKKTALQWFIEQIENHNGVTRAGFQKCIDEALQMEKEQIIDAYLCGDSNGCGCYEWSTEDEALEWFNEKYNEVQNKKG